MICPWCTGKTKVKDSWIKGGQVLRIRTCHDCGKEMQTRERRTIHEPEESRWNTTRGKRKE